MRKDIRKKSHHSLDSFLLGISIIQLIGCASSYNTTVDHWDIRRNQQISNVDTGIPVKKGKPQLSLSYQYALQEPGVQQFQDTMISSYETEIIDVDLFETRHVLSVEILFSFIDYVSSGLLLDLSFGDINNSSILDKSVLQKNIVETAMFLRFAADIKKLSIGFRPEMLFYSTNYQHIKSIDSTIVIDENFHHLGITFKFSVFSRYTILDRFALFSGFQYKRQPYVKYDNRLQYESAFGLYAGVGVNFHNQVFIEPYIAIPLGTDFTEYKSPPQVGLKLSSQL